MIEKCKKHTGLQKQKMQKHTAFSQIISDTDADKTRQKGCG